MTDLTTCKVAGSTPSLTTAGRRFRIPTVIDNCTRKCLALMADTSISGLRTARELDRLVQLHGRRETIVSDDGTELTFNVILRWADETGVRWHYIMEASSCSCRTSSRPWPQAFRSQPAV